MHTLITLTYTHSDTHTYTYIYTYIHTYIHTYNSHSRAHAIYLRVTYISCIIQVEVLHQFFRVFKGGKELEVERHFELHRYFTRHSGPPNRWILCSYIHTYIHTCTHIVILYEYLHLLSGVHTQSYYIQHNQHIVVFIHIYTYIHTYIHTYIYFHTLVFSFSFLPVRFIAAQSQIRFCLLWMIAESVYVFILKYLLTTFMFTITHLWLSGLVEIDVGFCSSVDSLLRRIHATADGCHLHQTGPPPTASEISTLCMYMCLYVDT